MSDDNSQQLRDKATELGIKFNPSIGDAKLTAKIVEKCKEDGIDISTVLPDYSPEEQDDLAKQVKGLTFASAAEKNKKTTPKALKEKEATKLVRVIISCNDPNKQAFTGDIFSVGNGEFQEQKKMVPFNVPTHITQMMLNMLREKMVQTHYKVKENGRTVQRTRLSPMFSIQELPPLTNKELEAIKQKQLAEQSNLE